MDKVFKTFEEFNNANDKVGVTYFQLEKASSRYEDSIEGITGSLENPTIPEQEQKFWDQMKTTLGTDLEEILCFWTDTSNTKGKLLPLIAASPSTLIRKGKLLLKKGVSKSKLDQEKMFLLNIENIPVILWDSASWSEAEIYLRAIDAMKIPSLKKAILASNKFVKFFNHNKWFTDEERYTHRSLIASSKLHL